MLDRMPHVELLILLVILLVYQLEFQRNPPFHQITVVILEVRFLHDQFRKLYLRINLIDSSL